MHDFLHFLKGVTILGATCLISIGLVLALLWILSLDERPARIEPGWWLPLAWPILPLLKLLGYRIGSSDRPRERGPSSAPAQQRRERICTTQQAKELLANRIAAEAEREGSPLTEIERKMLFFSETDWTLPDMAQVSAEFDRDYDQNNYEQKIARLIRRIVANKYSGNQTETETWDEAIEKLSQGDHYLTVLIGIGDGAGSVRQGFLPTLNKPAIRQSHDFFKLCLAAVIFLVGDLLLAACWSWIYWHSGPGFQAFSDWVFEDRDRRVLAILLVVLLIAFALRFKRVVGAFSNRK